MTKIIVGDVRGIRQRNYKNSKINAMIHNFWSFQYIIERLKTTAENSGIKVRLVKENNTSSICPRCGVNEDIQTQKIVQMSGLWPRSPQGCRGSDKYSPPLCEDRRI